MNREDLEILSASGPGFRGKRAAVAATLARHIGLMGIR